MNLWPYYDDDEIRAVERVLRSGKVNYWTGNECKMFEKEFANSVDCQYAVSLANGTVALELALWSLDIGPGDDVIVTPRSFFASVSSIVMRGARPIFADVNLQSQNIDAKSILKVITSRSRCILCVHLAGWPCEMDEIMDIAKLFNLFVIEDCAQAHGAKYKEKPVGSFGDISCWSFCQDKIISTGGEGGMITTNNKNLWKKCWSYKDHGKDLDLIKKQNDEIGFRWLHSRFGTNGRMTEMQAAIGRVQLKKLTSWLHKRRKNAALWNKLLSQSDCLRIITPPQYIEHSYYKYYVFLEKDKIKDDWSRDRLLWELNNVGVPAIVGSCPEIYREEAVKKALLSPKHPLPNARELGETSICLPVHPTIHQRQICAWAEQILRVLSIAKKF